MRSGKTIELMKQNLATLLEVIRSPLDCYRYYDYYKVGYWFHKENEADDFRKLLLFNIGFNSNRVETLKVYRGHGYVIFVAWHESEQEDLIENIERYLQEDNMGPTNINRENTKFYAIVTDKNGKQTAYEITHLSLESRMECCFGGSSITHRLEFDQDRLVKCDCVFAEWVKQKDELEKLRAENEKLKDRLGKCEDQLRSACELLNGYGDEYIDIPSELKNLDHFSSIINYTTIGENKRREFGKMVAEQVKRRAGWHGVWRKQDGSKMIEEEEKILDDAVESAINPYYITLDEVKAERIKVSPYYIQQRKSGTSKAMEMIKDMCDKNQLRLRLNSIYGLYAENDVKATQEMFAWRSKKPWLYEWNSNCETTPHMNVNIYDSIKDVKFANPATIVFWKDGTKTVVKAQDDEEYVPEIGLAMCICKKVMGNTRDYYRVFLHWLKKVKED